MMIAALISVVALLSFRMEASEVLRVSEPMFVELQVTSAKREAYAKKLKASGNTSAEDISEVGSDIEFYRAEAIEYVKKKGLKSVTTAADKVVFIMKSGKEFVVENDLDGFDSRYYLFNAEKPPELVQEIVVFPSSGLYESLFADKAADPCGSYRQLVMPAMNAGKSTVVASVCDSTQLYLLAQMNKDWSSVIGCMKLGKDQGAFPTEWLQMMMYVNGYGVAKKLDVAKKLACGLDDVGLRDRLLAAIDDSQDATKIFDVCDHVKTTTDSAVCNQVRASAKFIQYEAKIDMYRPRDHGALFDQMKAAAKMFMEKRSQLEIDLSGSGRGTAVTREHDLQWRDFIETFEAISQSKVRKYTAADLKDREAVMAEHLKKIRAKKLGGTLKANDVVEVQKAWEGYRDATVAYASKAHRSDQMALRCWMTIKRNHMLKSLQR